MDKHSHRCALDVPVQVSDDGTISGVTDSEQRDLHYDADGTSWQGRSILVTPRGDELGGEIEGHDGRRWDDAVADDDGRDGGLWDLECDGKLDGEEEKAVRQDSFVAPWDNGGGASVAATAAVGLRLRRMVSGDSHAKRSGYTDVLTCRENSSLPPAPGDVSATGRTRDALTPQGTARRHAADRHAKGGGPAAATAAHAVARAEAERDAALVRAHMLEFKLAAAEARATAEPAPAVADNSPLRAIVDVFHDDGDIRHPDEASAAAERAATYDVDSDDEDAEPELAGDARGGGGAGGAGGKTGWEWEPPGGGDDAAAARGAAVLPPTPQQALGSEVPAAWREVSVYETE